MSSSVATMLADPTVQIALTCVLISLFVGECKTARCRFTDVHGSHRNSS